MPPVSEMIPLAGRLYSAAVVNLGLQLDRVSRDIGVDKAGRLVVERQLVVGAVAVEPDPADDPGACDLVVNVVQRRLVGTHPHDKVAVGTAGLHQDAAAAVERGAPGNDAQNRLMIGPANARPVSGDCATVVQQPADDELKGVADHKTSPEVGGRRSKPVKAVQRVGPANDIDDAAADRPQRAASDGRIVEINPRARAGCNQRSPCRFWSKSSSSAVQRNDSSGSRLHRTAVQNQRLKGDGVPGHVCVDDAGRLVFERQIIGVAVKIEAAAADDAGTFDRIVEIGYERQSKPG